MYLPFPVTKLQDTNFLVPFALVSKQLHNTSRDYSGDIPRIPKNASINGHCNHHNSQ